MADKRTQSPKGKTTTKTGTTSKTTAKKQDTKTAPKTQSGETRTRSPRRVREPTRRFEAKNIDPFIDSRSVEGLNSDQYEDFLAEKDITLVMFYNPTEPLSEWSRKHFLKAAKTYDRKNSAFAAVDCTKEKNLCQYAGVTSLPFFSLYSKGKVVGQYNNPQQFTYDRMIGFVEKSPAIPEPPACINPCDRE